MCFRGIDIISNPGTRTRRGWRGMNYHDVVLRLGLHLRAMRENESGENGAYDFNRSITSTMRFSKGRCSLPSLPVPIPSETTRVSFYIRPIRWWLRISLVINIDYVSNVHARGSSMITYKLHLRHFLSHFFCLESHSRIMSRWSISAWYIISRIVNLTIFC